MSASHNSHPDARKALVEVLAYFKYEVTDFEASMWTRLIQEFGDQAVVNFLQQHVRTSTFAPKIADAQRLLSPVSANEEAAFLKVTAEVRRCGPYGAPRFAEDPAIELAIHQLGGWAALNAELPDPSARWDYEAFQRRFAAAYQLARSQHLVLGAQAAPRIALRGLHQLTAPGERALRIANDLDADAQEAYAAPKPDRRAAAMESQHG